MLPTVLQKKNNLDVRTSDVVDAFHWDFLGGPWADTGIRKPQVACVLGLLSNRHFN